MKRNVYGRTRMRGSGLVAPRQLAATKMTKHKGGKFQELKDADGQKDCQKDEKYFAFLSHICVQN